MSYFEPHPLHKYCPKCGLWRDANGTHCTACGTTLVLKQLNSHPDPASKHDGKLDIQGKHEVSYWPDKLERQTWVCIEETDDLLDEPEHVQLTLKQALSLLAWLRQEEAELQRMAKEQGQ